MASGSISHIVEKRVNGFSYNFQDESDIRQGTIWNVLEMLRLTPWTQGICFYFLHLCLLAALPKTVQPICMKFSGYVGPDTTKTIGRTLSHLTRLFHGPHTSGSVMHVCFQHFWKWMNGFSWNFRVRSDITRGTSWKKLGMMHFTLWIQRFCSIS